MDHHARIGSSPKRHAHDEDSQKRDHHRKCKLYERRQQSSFFSVVATGLNRAKEHASRDAGEIGQRKTRGIGKDKNPNSSAGRRKTEQIRIDDNPILSSNTLHGPRSFSHNSSESRQQHRRKSRARNKARRYKPKAHYGGKRGIAYEKGDSKKTGKEHLPRVLVAAKHPLKKE